MTYLDKSDYIIRREGGNVLLCRNDLTINLTYMFGSGKEPATVEEACDLIMQHTNYLWKVAFEFEALLLTEDIEIE